MKHFQKIIICLVVLTLNFVFIQTDLLPQNDSLINQENLVIGGLYKVTFLNGQEALGNILDYDSVSIKLIYKENIVKVKKVQIKSIEKLKYLLQFDTDKTVTVTTKNGFLYKGRLLTATENNITLISNDTINKQDNIGFKNIATEIKKDSIKRILIHGESNILSGLGYGALIGTGTGAFIGLIGSWEISIFPNEKETSSSTGQNILIGGLIGSLAGGVLGLIYGLANSTSDEIIEINYDDDFYRLNKYSTFSFGEPPIYRNQKKKNSK